MNLTQDIHARGGVKCPRLMGPSEKALPRGPPFGGRGVRPDVRRADGVSPHERHPNRVVSGQCHCGSGRGRGRRGNMVRGMHNTGLREGGGGGGEWEEEVS